MIYRNAADRRSFLRGAEAQTDYSNEMHPEHETGTIITVPTGSVANDRNCCIERLTRMPTYQLFSSKFELRTHKNT